MKPSTALHFLVRPRLVNYLNSWCVPLQGGTDSPPAVPRGRPPPRLLPQHARRGGRPARSRAAPGRPAARAARRLSVPGPATKRGDSLTLRPRVARAVAGGLLDRQQGAVLPGAAVLDRLDV